MTDRVRQHAARGMLLRTPWPSLLLAATSAGSVTAVSALRPTGAIPLFVIHLAAVALASGAAYLLDDVAIAVTASAPRGLWRRRAPALFVGLAVVAAAWTVVVALLRRRPPGPSTSALTIEVLALVLIALAAAAVTARTGESEPGNLVAPAIVLVGIGALIAQPALHVTLFIGGLGDPDRRVWWLGAAVAATMVLIIASRDPATPPMLRGRRTADW
jgi:hypothetical protein